MNQSKKQYTNLVMLLPATIVIAGAAGWLLLYYFIPASYFRWYPLIPAYFILMSIFIACGANHYYRCKPAKIIRVYMLSRTIKMLLTLAGVFLYYKLSGENITAMLLTTLAFYILFLLVETRIFYRLEKMARQTRLQDV